MNDVLKKETVSSVSETNLIVKENFYVGLSSASEFKFFPTGSCLKFVRHNTSVMPYYELETHTVYVNYEGNEFSFKGSRTINTKVPLKLKNCSTKLINNRIDYGNARARWDDLFVQSFESIVKV